MIPPLSKAEVREYAAVSGLRLTDAEAEAIEVVARNLCRLVDELDELPPLAPAVLEAKRDPGRRPAAGEDPYNAVVRWCRIKAQGADGPLAGLRVGLKDMVQIAGVPMTCGSALMQDYVPDRDAIVTERLLAAGAEIVAVTNMEDFAFSAGGEASHYGTIRNPYDLDRTASGSSGGSAAALYYDGIDVTFGTDQGGSIRLPASWCGVLGLKPTYGLVPYGGLAPLDPTYDHVGPLARSVPELARALEAVAGKHELDPWQPASVPVEPYAEAVRRAPDDLRGIRVGAIVETLAPPADDEQPAEGTLETIDATWLALDRMSDLGAEVVELSIPEQELAAKVMFAALCEGYAATFAWLGADYHVRGLSKPEFGPHLAHGLATAGEQLHPTVKAVLVMGNYLRRLGAGRLYAKARDYEGVVRDAYDRALESVDFLCMPSATHYAHRAKPDAPIAETIMRAWECNRNGGATNMSGHPSLGMPAAEADGLPVGVTLVARRFREADALAFARTYEGSFGWLPAADPRDSVTVPR